VHKWSSEICHIYIQCLKKTGLLRLIWPVSLQYSLIFG